MPRLLTLLLLATLPACVPQSPPPTARTPQDRTTSLPASLPPAGSLPGGDQATVHPPLEIPPDTPVTPLATHRVSIKGLSLTILTFDSRSHTLHVLDNEAGPGTGADSAGAAAGATRGLAAVNGGFFTPEGQPLGLVYENGRKYGGLSSSSLGAGLYLSDPPRYPALLVRRPVWQDAHAGTTPAHLLQSGPFLMERGRAVTGLSTSPARPRSFLLTDGANGWAIGSCSSATLAGLALALASQPIPGLTIRNALNLDGGSSTDLWIAPSVKGGPASERPFFRKSVRNYLVLVPVQP